MAYDPVLAERIRPLVGKQKTIAEKKMFGGIGWLVNGNMAVGIWMNALVVRVGPEAYAACLEEPHVGEFDITGRPMRGWVLVATEAIATKKDLQRWLDLGLSFAASLPAK
jgi:TfoX/Sxy family transcriptional regulator of competence genes